MQSPKVFRFSSISHAFITFVIKQCYYSHKVTVINTFGKTDTHTRTHTHTHTDTHPQTCWIKTKKTHFISSFESWCCEHRGCWFHSVFGIFFFFRNRVCVLGGGEYACNAVVLTVQSLCGFCPFFLCFCSLDNNNKEFVRPTV